eukprot:CFRG2692T1
MESSTPRHHLTVDDMMEDLNSEREIARASGNSLMPYKDEDNTQLNNSFKGKMKDREEILLKLRAYVGMYERLKNMPKEIHAIERATEELQCSQGRNEETLTKVERIHK